MIKVNALYKNYASNEVLKNVTLQFEPGKVYGIVGQNGAGKTTLFRCIAGFEDYQGEITATLQPLKNHLAYLMTESFFFPKITGEEYIRLFTNARNIPLENLHNKNIFDLPLKEFASNYSTGMKKKLALTALLLQENDYFILDEPFNGVDIQSNMILTEIILKLKELNKIVLISSHIFATLQETCDQIIHLQKGKDIRIIKKEMFPELEKEMKAACIGKRLDKLEIFKSLEN